jgi:acetyl esterase
MTGDRCGRRWSVAAVALLGVGLLVVAAAGQPVLRDVPYGPDPRQVLDVYPASGGAVTDRPPGPVLVFFHGGGFVQGDKSQVSASLRERAGAAGVTVVSANYRFVTGGPDYRTPYADAARVVQTVRQRADQWHVDPDRLVVAGSSAGGVMALWLGLHDDLADTDADDPVARQSTRPAAVLAFSTPTTLLPEEILAEVGGPPHIHGVVLDLFNAPSLEALRAGGALRAAVEDASPLTHLTADDPPVFLRYGMDPTDTLLPATTSTSVSIHHANFGRLLERRAAAVGVRCVLHTPGRDAGPDEFAFLADLLAE